MPTNNSINLSDSGIIAYDGAGTFEGRTLQPPAAGITISDGDGISGNPTFALSDDLAAIEALATTGIAARTAANTWATRTITAGTGVSISDGDGIAGNPTISAAAAVPTTFTTDSGTATPVANNVNVLGGTGIDTTGAGDTVTVTFDVTEVATIPTSINTDSGAVTPAANAFAVITAANDGLTTSGAGANLTITTTDDLAAIEALNTTGYAVRTAANTWSLRTFQEGTGIDLTNGDGVSGNTTIAFDVTEVTSIPTSFAADSGTATPAANVITIAGGTNVTTSASGSTITIDSTGGSGFAWVEETGTTHSLLVNEGVVANNAGLVTCTLPGTAAVGDTIQIYAKGAGLFRIAQNGGQQIRGLSTTTTLGAGGRVDVQSQGTWVELVCITANTLFGMRSFGTVTLT